MTNPVKYIVGIDGGGSGCRVRLEDATGQVLATVVGGPANVLTNFDTARANLLATIGTAYRQAGLSPERRRHDVALAGLAGAGDSVLARRMESELGFSRIRVTTDCAITAEGALDGHDGIVVLVGTGSFFLRRKQGQERRIGGWGYQLGDEASGAWLGREALRRVLWAEDGLQPHSGLTRALLARFGGTAGAIARFAQNATPGEMAALAPDIITAAGGGDPVSNEILDEATTLIEDRLMALGARALGAVVLTGGLADVYHKRLAECWDSVLRPSAGTALDGAVALARQQLLTP